jgi:hypothetical protein
MKKTIASYLVCAFTLLTIFASLEANAAKFTVRKYYGNRYHVIMTGPIVHGDDVTFRDIVMRQLAARRLITGMRIYSPGGDVDAALAIGSIIRTLHASTFAPDKSTGAPVCDYGGLGDTAYSTGQECSCESACSLIWVSGEGRWGSPANMEQDDKSNETKVGAPMVGFHAPRFNEAFWGTLTPSEMREKYPEVSDKISKYFATMTVPPWTITIMLENASIDMHYITPYEARQFYNYNAGINEGIITLCRSKYNPGTPQYINCKNNFLEEDAASFAKQFCSAYGCETKVATPEKLPQTPPPVIPDTTPRSPEPPKVTRVTYSNIVNADLYGSDLVVGGITGLDQAGCVARCTNTQGCQGFSFDRWNALCFLKADISMTELRLDPRSTSGAASGTATPQLTQLPKTMKKIHRKLPSGSGFDESARFYDKGYSTVMVANYDSCLQTCRNEDLKCNAVTFQVSTSMCSLYETTGQYYRYDPQTGLPNTDWRAALKSQDN